ncbi:MAG: Fur family transcriptional regulator [Candidatus Pacebacteria bacterium]|nr:Fur family transcriptional regulator [Candidatus Paceibacterota bacterium]
MTTKEKESYAALLRTHGLKATPQRVQVLGLLASARKPVSISELQKKAEKSNEALDSVTLYRSLEMLVENSLARPVDLRHGHTDYELTAGREHHHHIVCVKCGAIEDFEWCPEPDLEKKILRNTKSFAKLTDHSLEFFGVCKKCITKN